MTDTQFSLADFLPYQLSIASNAVSNRIASVYHDAFGLKVTEWRIMAMLGDAGALTQRQLTEKTLMDKVAVNRGCKMLEGRGLVVRLPNRKDGRSHHLELTDEGRAIHAKVVPMARKMEASLLEPLTDQERGQFMRLLEKVRQQAE